MLKARVIPCLDVKDGRVVKGVNFVNLRELDPPEWCNGGTRATDPAECNNAVAHALHTMRTLAAHSWVWLGSSFLSQAPFHNSFRPFKGCCHDPAHDQSTIRYTSSLARRMK